MITAILKQNIRKRIRQLPVPDKGEGKKIGFRKAFVRKKISGKLLLKESALKKTPARKLLLKKPMEEVQPGNTEPGKGQWWLIVPGITLLLLFSLVLVAFKFNLFTEFDGPEAGISVELHEDLMFEEALSGFILSDDVPVFDEPVSGDAGIFLPDSLKISHYLLKKGETISGVAKKNNLNIDTIISYNNIKMVKRVKPGTKLAIPSADGIIYKVRRGDNLSNIAKRHRIPLNTLLDWNNITSSLILVGTEYFIPGAKMRRNDLNRALGKLFIFPTVGRLTSSFGWRSDPISMLRRFHNGIDMANKKNTPIKAAMDGRVLKVSYSRIYGKYIIIKHDDGFQTLYGHLVKQQVKNGQYIQQGKQIGLMGNTGYSTGNHLHFSIFKNGEPVNPYKYLK